MKGFQELKRLPQDFYSDLIQRVYQGDAAVLELYPEARLNYDPEKLMAAKGEFSQQQRDLISAELRQQYGDLADGPVKTNILKLQEPNTFTITTGQQIHIMLGPMYVIYKILSTIRLASKLCKQFPENHFVPVFWMASEDHDLAEIDHFRLFSKDFKWETPETGPVGRFQTNGFEKLKQEMELAFPADEKVKQVLGLFFDAYRNNKTLAEATRALLHHFFGKEGLVVLDPDSAALKKTFSSIMEDELLNNSFNSLLSAQSVKMKELGLKTQISPRNTNIFVLTEAGRERLDRTEDGFITSSSCKYYSVEDLQKMMSENPENLSPNVALRPLYQEHLLPNLAYIAGPGEYTYWFQIYPLFKKSGLAAPAIKLRNSIVLADEKLQQWLNENGWDLDDMFGDSEWLKAKLINDLKANNPLSGLKSGAEEIFTQINSELYKSKSVDLKSLKKQSEQYLKDLARAMKAIDDNLLLQPEVSARWNKLNKWKDKGFHKHQVQERTVYFLELLIQKPDLLSLLGNIPDAEIAPLTVFLD